jgi:hypothetical protein
MIKKYFEISILKMKKNELLLYSRRNSLVIFGYSICLRLFGVDIF